MKPRQVDQYRRDLALFADGHACLQDVVIAFPLCTTTGDLRAVLFTGAGYFFARPTAADEVPYPVLADIDLARMQPGQQIAHHYVGLLGQPTEYPVSLLSGGCPARC